MYKNIGASKVVHELRLNPGHFNSLVELTAPLGLSYFVKVITKYLMTYSMSSNIK